MSGLSPCRCKLNSQHFLSSLQMLNPKFKLIYLAKEMQKNYNPLKYGFPNLNSNIVNEMPKNTTITIHFYPLSLLQQLLLTT